MKRFTWLFALVSACSLAAIQSACADTIVNIDLEGYRTTGGGINNNPATTYSGVGAAGGGTFFNGIFPNAVSDASSTTTGDLQTLTATHLLSDTGATTNVGFSISNIGTDNETASTTPTDSNVLFGDYVFNHSAGSQFFAGNSPFTISGLVSGATYQVYAYGTSLSTLTINGATSMAFTPSGVFTTGNTHEFSVVANGSGIITGALGANTNVLNGLSIFSTAPEPSSFVLCGLGAIGMLVVVRRRRAGLVAGLLPCLFALALGLTSATANASHYSAAVLADNPVAYWQFGEANGTVGTPIPMGTTSLNSGALGSSANGTYSNGNATVGSIIPVSQFYGMGGSPSVSMTVSGPNHGQIQGSDAGFPSGNSDRTIVAWVDTSAAAGAWHSAAYYGSSNTGNAIFLGAPQASSNAMGASQYADDLNGTTAINNGAWHMLAFTVTGTTAGQASYTLYVDGQADGTKSMQTNTTLGQFLLGNDVGGGPFSGQLAQVAIFNSALSGGQVSALYQAALVPEPASVLLMVVGLVGVVFIGYRRSKMFAVAPARN